MGGGGRTRGKWWSRLWRVRCECGRYNHGGTLEKLHYHEGTKTRRGCGRRLTTEGTESTEEVTEKIREDGLTADCADGRRWKMVRAAVGKEGSRRRSRSRSRKRIRRRRKSKRRKARSEGDGDAK